MTRPRILFVDDELAVLDGLRNLLRKERAQWEMVFALEASAALAHIAAQPFDVVVADLRMPRMSGAQLLAIVRERYPHSVRIVLSGHAERELLEHAATVADVTLSKPCDAAVLRAALAEALYASSQPPPTARLRHDGLSSERASSTSSSHGSK